MTSTDMTTAACRFLFLSRYHTLHKSTLSNCFPSAGSTATYECYARPQARYFVNGLNSLFPRSKDDCLLHAQ